MSERAADTIEIRFAGGEPSGFASIVQQYLEQQLADSRERRRRAARLHGRMALSATDYGVAVTLEFGGHAISIHDGAEEPLDATVAGPYQSLLGLLQGRGNPLLDHLHGRLKVHSRWGNLFLPLRVHRLMKLDPEEAEERPVGANGG